MDTAKSSLATAEGRVQDLNLIVSDLTHQLNVSKMELAEAQKNQSKSHDDMLNVVNQLSEAEKKTSDIESVCHSATSTMSAYGKRIVGCEPEYLSPEQIGDLLSLVNLGRYRDRIIQNGVGGKFFVQGFSDSELENDIGLHTIGDRRRFDFLRLLVSNGSSNMYLSMSSLSMLASSSHSSTHLVDRGPLGVFSFLKSLVPSLNESSVIKEQIDGRALLCLTSSDLANLGVKNISHRRKIIETIRAELHGVLPGTDEFISPSLNKSQSERTNIPLHMTMCPITHKPMEDPFVAADGNSYEKYAIVEWLKTSDVSPSTGKPLTHKHITPNSTLKALLSRQPLLNASIDLGQVSHLNV